MLDQENGSFAVEHHGNGNRVLESLVIDIGHRAAKCYLDCSSLLKRHTGPECYDISQDPRQKGQNNDLQ